MSQGRAVALRFKSLMRARVTVQSSPDLLNWEELGTAISETESTLWAIPVPVDSFARFFRLLGGP